MVIMLLLAAAITTMAQNIDQLFPEVASLKEEDEMDLRGMKYNETQVSVFSTII